MYDICHFAVVYLYQEVTLGLIPSFMNGILLLWIPFKYFVYMQIDPEVKEAFDVAYDNIYAFHAAQKLPEKIIENMKVIHFYLWFLSLAYSF